MLKTQLDKFHDDYDDDDDDDDDDDNCPSFLNSPFISLLILQQSSHFSLPVPDLLTINDQLTDATRPKTHVPCEQNLKILNL